MPDKSNQNSVRTTIGVLYPQLTDKEQADTAYRLVGYLAIVKRIFERVCRERPKILTELEERARLRRRGGGSDPSS